MVTMLLRGLPVRRLKRAGEPQKIRDDNGYWTKVEAYVMAPSAAQFTHGICPPCATTHYPEITMSSRPIA